MNIYLDLLLTFLKIGAFSFGGGYGMISLMREECLAHGWLTEAELLNFIAVAESTPGPIAVNMATFVGSSEGGILGALVATAGVVLPSFFIILLIASVMKNLIRYAPVKAALAAVVPVIIGLIITTGLSMLISMVFGACVIGGEFGFNLSAFLIFTFLCVIGFLYKKTKKNPISPILVIVVAALLGVAEMIIC